MGAHRMAVMKVPQHITSLSRADLQELADLTNLTVGPGILITRHNGGIRLEVNQTQIRRWIRAFYQNGGTACPLDQIDEISLDLS